MFIRHVTSQYVRLHVTMYGVSEVQYMTQSTGSLYVTVSLHNAVLGGEWGWIACDTLLSSGAECLFREQSVVRSFESYPRQLIFCEKRLA